MAGTCLLLPANLTPSWWTLITLQSPMEQPRQRGCVPNPKGLNCSTGRTCWHHWGRTSVDLTSQEFEDTGADRVEFEKELPGRGGGSAEGQSYLGKAYLDSWGSLTPCLGMYGMPGARGEAACLLRPSSLAKRSICSFSGRGHSRRVRTKPGRSKLSRGQETGGPRLVRCGSHSLDFLDYGYKNLPPPPDLHERKSKTF